MNKVMKTALVLGLVCSSVPVRAQHDHGGMKVPESETSKASVEFKDAQAQMEQFILYNKTIKLDAKQQKIKEQALDSIPAPCCKEFSILTCCCPCNLAKSVWGLSHYLIAKRKSSAEEVNREVRRWLAFVNPSGFTGDACDTGGCSRPLSKNGCGGMDDKHPVEN